MILRLGILLIFLGLVSLDSHSQQMSKRYKIQIPAMLSLSNSEPQLVMMDVSVDSFQGQGIINPLSWRDEVVFDLDGKKRILGEDQIDKIEIYGGDSVIRTIMSEKIAGYQYPKENLVERIFDGKIEWYCDYKPGRTLSDEEENAKVKSAIYTGSVFGGMIIGTIAGDIAMNNAINEGRAFLVDYLTCCEMLIKRKDGVTTYSYRLQNIEAMMGDRPDLDYRVQNLRKQNILGWNLLELLMVYNREYVAPEDRLIPNLERLDKIKNNENLQLIPFTEQLNVEERNSIIYLSKSGEKAGFYLKAINSQFSKILYFNEEGKRLEASVKNSDLLIVKEKSSSD